MSEVDGDLTNGDDAVFKADDQQNHVESVTEIHEIECSNTSNTIDDTSQEDHSSGSGVYVATSHGLINANSLQDGCIDDIKSMPTHVVIHDTRSLPLSGVDFQSLTESPCTPLPPPTPATPLSREKGFKYQWDTSAFNDIIPVRCKNSNGELHKSKFGSGNILNSSIFSSHVYKVAYGGLPLLKV